MPLSRNPASRSGNSGFDELQTQFRGALLEQDHLLFPVSRFVVVEALIDVLVPPFEQAIDQTGELVRHRGDRLRCAESGAEATVLRTEIALTPQQGGGREP